jgi:hypothetical protein
LSTFSAPKELADEPGEGANSFPAYAPTAYEVFVRQWERHHLYTPERDRFQVHRQKGKQPMTEAERMGFIEVYGLPSGFAPPLWESGSKLPHSTPET